MMGNQLGIYTVHWKADAKTPQQPLILVREGFNWHAFIFTHFWALYQGLWRALGLILLINISVSLLVVELHLHPFSLFAMQLGMQVWFGYQANDFLRKKLDKKGYILSDIVSGENEMRAEQRFLDRNTALLPTLLA